jgi:hypothetical protein
MLPGVVAFALDLMRVEKVCLCGLTFELSGRQRQDARPRAVMMHHVPQAGLTQPAVAGQRLSEG